MKRTSRDAYHHGDLRRALMAEALRVIEDEGPAALSLRDLARRLGVSHAAPAHHFGDKAGLLTAIATEGFDLLADELGAAYTTRDDFLEVGVAYVRFAMRHRGHFEVMYRPELYRRDDPALVRARERSGATLYAGVRDLPPDDAREARAAAVAAWSLVHGLATLLLNGNLPDEWTDDPEALARAAARNLFAGARR